MNRLAVAAVMLGAMLRAAAADEVIVVTPSPPMFFRPIADAPPDVTVLLTKDSITAATPCFERGLVTDEVDAQGAFDVYTSGFEDSPDCEAQRPAFDAFDARFRRTAGIRHAESGLVLTAADGSVLMELERIEPKGFEFRQLVVKSFRENGQLRPAKRALGFASVLLGGGRIWGSVGCGGLTGSTYRARPAGLDFRISSLSSPFCSNEPRAAEQEAAITRAFTGERSVEQNGDDFILRDARGNAQIVLSRFDRMAARSQIGRHAAPTATQPGVN